MLITERVRQVREYLGLSQIELAERVGVSQSAIARIETGHLTPSERFLADLAACTGFPVNFYERPIPAEFPQGSLLFRARASASSADRIQAYQSARLFFELHTRLAKKYKPLPVRIPQVQESTSLAAALMRDSLGLAPETPIPNLLNALERAGVTVLLLPKPLPHIDAFSVWAGENGTRPVIVIGPNTSPDRLRFNLAHELGHLVMHRAVVAPLADLERTAHEFAGELLLPEQCMRQELAPPLTLTALSQAKVRWRVSMQALIMRAKELNIIKYHQYRYLYEQLAAKHWITSEPLSEAIPYERPRGLRQLLEMVHGTPLNSTKIAAAHDLPPSLIDFVVTGYEAKTTSSSRQISGESKVVALPSSRG